MKTSCRFLKADCSLVGYIDCRRGRVSEGDVGLLSTAGLGAGFSGRPEGGGQRCVRCAALLWRCLRQAALGSHVGRCEVGCVESGVYLCDGARRKGSVRGRKSSKLRRSKRQCFRLKKVDGIVTAREAGSSSGFCLVEQNSTSTYC